MKNGFSLAEILITLGIVGIIAAMTIPNMITAYQDKVIVNMLPEVYSILQQAYKMSAEDNGPISNWNLSSDKVTARGEIIDKFLPYVKSYYICNSGNTKCTSRMILDLNGKEVTGLQTYNLVLGNTVKVNFDETSYTNVINKDDCEKYGGCYYNNEDNSSPIPVTGTAHTIIINVTGRENKPKLGRDLFLFAILNDGVIPFGEVGWHKTSDCNPTGSSSAGWWNGATCAGYVLKHKNVNYLKCTRGQQKYCTGNYQP